MLLNARVSFEIVILHLQLRFIFLTENKYYQGNLLNKATKSNSECEAWGVTQGPSTCLACPRHGVPSTAPKISGNNFKQIL